MKNRIYFQLIPAILFVLANFSSSFGQSFCDAAGDAAADNTAIAWKLRPETKSGNWATTMKPVVQEMQRSSPQPPKGLEITYGIYDAMNVKDAAPNDIQYYESFFMIKDIVCLKYQGKNHIEPEGETGNWIYFRANDFKVFLNNFTSPTSISMPSNNQKLYVAGDIRIEENSNGLKSIYFFNENNEQKFAGWYFSEKKITPYQRITNFELGLSYREYWLAKFDVEIERLEGVLATSKKTFARVSTEKGVKTEAEKQIFFQSLREGDRQTQQAIDRYKSQREDCIKRTDAIMTDSNAKNEAYIKNLNDLIYEPNNLTAANGKGRYVYVENLEIFDKTLPKWKPQFVTVQLRRQDTSPAKIAFTKKFEDEFDFNVIRQMVGMKPLPNSPTISNMGDSPVRNSYKSIANTDSNGETFFENFADANIGQAPNKWTVSNNSSIVKDNVGQAGNWLAMSKEGLFFPDYAVLALPKSFTLEFDVSWTKSISYYSPSFYFHIGAARYDNTLKRYDRAQVNQNSYTSAKMERIALWIDPHWNNEYGRYGFQVFDARGGYILDKADKTQIYFKNKNLVKVKLVRQGSLLTVYFNGTKMTEDAVLSETISWNFFGFSLNTAPNAEAGDEFYLSNIRLSKFEN